VLVRRAQRALEIPGRQGRLLEEITAIKKQLEGFTSK